METYSFLRELADSWVLLALTLFFLGAIAWAFRPGSADTHRDIAGIPLRDDTYPLDVSAEGSAEPCTNKCPDCTCTVATTFDQEPKQ